MTAVVMFIASIPIISPGNAQIFCYYYASLFRVSMHLRVLPRPIKAFYPFANKAKCEYKWLKSGAGIMLAAMKFYVGLPFNRA